MVILSGLFIIPTHSAMVITKGNAPSNISIHRNIPSITPTLSTYRSVNNPTMQENGCQAFLERSDLILTTWFYKDILSTALLRLNTHRYLS